MKQRYLSFANSAVTVSYAEGRPAEMVDYLFRRLPNPDGVEAHIDLSLSEDEARRLVLKEGGVPSLTTDSFSAMAEWVASRVGFHLADKSQGGALFHAAAVRWRDRAVVLPGKIGAGKTTLACWLVAHGLGYLSDEFVFVQSGDDRLSAFPRPLNVKQSALPVVKPYFRKTGNHETILEGKFSSLVPPERFSPQEVISQASAGLLLFPDFQSGSEFRLERLTASDAGLALMRTVLNLRNLPGHGLSETAWLVNHLPVFRLTYAGFDQLDENNFLAFLKRSLQG
jgi:hypothetical protein